MEATSGLWILGLADFLTRQTADWNINKRLGMLERRGRMEITYSAGIEAAVVGTKP